MEWVGLMAPMVKCTLASSKMGCVVAMEGFRIQKAIITKAISPRMRETGMGSNRGVLPVKRQASRCTGEISKWVSGTETGLLKLGRQMKLQAISRG